MRSKSGKKILAAGAILFIAAGLSLFLLALHFDIFNPDTVNVGSEQILYKDRLIKDVFTDKARYLPGSSSEVTINLENTANLELKGVLYLILKHLDQTVAKQKTENVILKPGEKREQVIRLKLPDRDFQGYMLEVWLKEGENYLDAGFTAIDVSSRWTKFPRYGYIAGYSRQDGDKAEEIIKELNKYHINGLQFYDWQYKHHDPVAGTVDSIDESWNEIANRKVYAKTVTAYIDAAHSRSMAAMNYNLLFGAWKGYENDGVKREWGLFKDVKHEQQDFHPLPSGWASDRIYLFNPQNAGWQQYIMNREKEVFRAFEFDGWHIDQLGSRDQLYDYSGTPVELTAGYSSLIQRAGKELPGKTLVFNAVNQYGQLPVASDGVVSFLYAEIWNTSTYSNLKMAIDEGYRYTDGKMNTVLAAYMNYRKKSGEFNEHSVRLADAVIFACGGSHMELGDKGMLSSEYFPSAKLVMSDSLKESMRRYYDFLSAYENFLRDGVSDIKRNVEIREFQAGSGILPGTVWHMSKAKDNYEILHLINFLVNNTNQWRDDLGTMEKPSVKTDFTLKYYSEDDFKKILLLSPDSDMLMPKALEFRKGSDRQGSFVELTVPKLEYWDMIVFEKEE